MGLMMSDERNTVMLPRIENRIQEIRGLKAEVVANCEHLQYLTAPPEPSIKGRTAP
jgi:hypothetical protein